MTSNLHGRQETVLEMIGGDVYVYKSEKDRLERSAHQKKKYLQAHPQPKPTKNSWLEAVEGRVYLMGGKVTAEVSSYLLRGDALI